MSPNDSLETLVKHLRNTPRIVLLVLQLFKVTKYFVAWVYNYQTTVPPESNLVEDWQEFTDVSSSLSHLSHFIHSQKAVCDIRVGDQRHMQKRQLSAHQYVPPSFTLIR